MEKCKGGLGLSRAEHHGVVFDSGMFHPRVFRTILSRVPLCILAVSPVFLDCPCDACEMKKKEI